MASKWTEETEMQRYLCDKCEKILYEMKNNSVTNHGDGEAGTLRRVSFSFGNTTERQMDLCKACYKDLLGKV